MNPCPFVCARPGTSPKRTSSSPTQSPRLSPSPCTTQQGDLWSIFSTDTGPLLTREHRWLLLYHGIIGPSIETQGPQKFRPHPSSRLSCYPRYFFWFAPLHVTSSGLPNRTYSDGYRVIERRVLPFSFRGTPEYRTIQHSRDQDRATRQHPPQWQDVTLIFAERY